jgi:hypothetical protein
VALTLTAAVVAALTALLPQLQLLEAVLTDMLLSLTLHKSQTYSISPCAQGVYNTRTLMHTHTAYAAH